MTAKRKPIRSLKDLRPDPANANRGTERGAAMLDQSLELVGAGRSILADRTGTVLAGNKTLDRWKRRKGAKPIRVIETDGSELVVVVRKDLDLKAAPDKARQAAYYDNRSAEVGLSWDIEQILRDREAGIDLSQLFGQKEIERLVAEAVEERDERIVGGLTGADDAPPLQETDIQVGDLFQLGEHRLLCGDCTSPEVVARVMGTDVGVLMNTDPPYGIDYVGLKKGMPGFKFSNDVKDGDIANDDLTEGAALQAFLETAIRTAVPHLSDRTAFYLWHPMLTQGTFFAAAAAAAAADIRIHRQIIWVKPGFVLTRSGMYHWKHELAFFGWRKGHQPPWYGPKNQVSVWEVGRDEGGTEHPTQKPIELFERPILNHTLKGEIVYEPFTGSGSQIIAAERLNRRCRAIELEPKYVDLAIRRWEAFTGETARKLGEVAVPAKKGRKGR